MRLQPVEFFLNIGSGGDKHCFLMQPVAVEGSPCLQQPGDLFGKPRLHRLDRSRRIAARRQAQFGYMADLRRYDSLQPGALFTPGGAKRLQGIAEDDQSPSSARLISLPRSANARLEI